jgi:hypothetical protein
MQGGHEDTNILVFSWPHYFAFSTWMSYGFSTGAPTRFPHSVQDPS